MLRALGALILSAALVGLWMTLFIAVPFYGLWRAQETADLIWACLGVGEALLAYCVWSGVCGELDEPFGPHADAGKVV